MKTFIILGVFGLVVWFAIKRGFVKQTSEVDESFAAAKDGEKRGIVANLLNIIRNPPVAQTGMRPLYTANVNPFSGSTWGNEREGQQLPKFVGLDSGSTLSPPYADVTTQVPSESIPSATEFLLQEAQR